ncbi:MAG: CotH kinase family protein [Prevotella sp.]|nr:CotH kinase family protein [Prevotella sp.]
MTRLFTAALFLALTTQTAKAQLIINELMQSNVDCYMVQDTWMKEFPDSWVELYNSGTEAVNLQDYKIGIKNKVSKAWQLPEKFVNPGEYVVVCCDKEEIENSLHTSFRLESDKAGSVFLFLNDEIVNQVDHPAMPAPNIAYGRLVINGADEWGYLDTPTPNAANSGTICKDAEGNPQILGDVVFGEKGRVMTTNQNISLTLSLPEGAPSGAVIRYTTDGSEPTASSTRYQRAISISRNSTVVRAKAFCTGWLSPMSTAQSYIFLGRDMKIPVISIVTKDSYMNDASIGILHSNNNSSKTNKVDWRRPVNIEMFETADAESVINQLGETRVAGGQSRENKLKTLAVYANKRFGTKRFDYEFFPDQKPGLRDFKSLMLRNSGNDFNGLYMRDAVIQRVMGQNTDIDWQAWKPAIIYLNGAYQGMLNIRERSNDDNIYSNYEGLEDIDMIEIVHEKVNNIDTMREELKAGTWDRYNAFKEFYSDKNGHTMAEYEEIMDVYEYINIMAMNLYYGNLDFPGNNIIVWAPTDNGGRWRWVAKDTDFGLGLYGRNPNYDTIEWIYNHNYDSGNAWANTPEATLLFRNLMADPDFNREFIDHCAIYMGDFMNGRGTHKIWDPMEDLAKSEIIQHRKKMGNTWNAESGVNNEINNVNNWLNQRTDYFYNFLYNHSDFHLGAPTPLIINKNVTEQVTTIVNGIEIKYTDDSHPSPYFDGKFFQNRSLTVEGKAGEGRRVKGWKVDMTNNNNSTSTQEVLKPIYTFNMPECKSLTLTALFEDFLLGDVNRDGFVNITDVTALVDIVLGRVTLENNPNNYDFDAADVDRNGDYTITDVTALVNIVLNPTSQTED